MHLNARMELREEKPEIKEIIKTPEIRVSEHRE